MSAVLDNSIWGTTLVGGEDNDMRTIRAWLNAMYPTAEILVQRDLARRAKPWFFIEHVDDKFQDRGRGWHDALRTWRIHLISEGPAEGRAAPSMLHASRRVLDGLAQRLLVERVIPRYAYNLPYPMPRASYLTTGGAFPLGTHHFAVTAVDVNGHETLPSEPDLVVPVTAANWRVMLQVPNWPTQQPLAHLYWVWHRTAYDAPWVPIGSAPPVINQRYTTELEVGSDLLPAARAPLPTECRLRLGHLKVQDAQVSMTESFLDDNAFHGNTQLRAFSRSYHVKPPAPPLQGIAVSINQQELVIP